MTKMCLAVLLLILGFASAPDKVCAADPTPQPDFGMVLYYKLDGNSLDASGFGRDGTPSGPIAATGKWGESGGALGFNGSSDYVSIPVGATTGLAKFSISLWVKTSEARTGSSYWTHPTILGLATSGSGSGDFGLCLNNGKPGFFGGLVANNDNSYYSATSVNDDTWHHLAAVNDGVTVKLYIDGALDTGGSILSGLPLANTGFYLGKSNLPDPLGYAGVIDDLRIYNRPLSAAEVDALFASAPSNNLPLAVTRTGAGGGTVAIAPTGLVCSEPNCGVLLPTSTAVTLKATPDVSSFFGGWSGACSGSGDCPLTLTAPAAVTASFTPWQSSLLGWYPLRGDASDASGSGNHGVVDGATPAPDRFGAAAGAYAFDGVDQSIGLTGSSPLNSSRTFSLWVLPQSNTGYGMPILTSGVSGAADFLGVGATAGPCGFGANRLYFHHWGQACIDSTVTLAGGAWNHIAVVYDDSASGTLTFYRNGVKVASVAGNMHDYPISTLLVGGNALSGLTTKPAFKGSLDDLAVYNRALTDAEILSLYYRQGVGAAITAPADGGSAAGTVINVTGTAKAVSGRTVGLVEVSLDGGATWQGATDASGNGSWTSWSYPWRPSVTGSYGIKARARDSAGYYELPGSAISVRVTSIYAPSVTSSFATAGDFDAGRKDGVGTGPDGLALTSAQQPLPFLWVPNLNDTVSKVDTASGHELGRYRTVPPGVSGVNSRTTVDLAGNVWLTNRQSGSVVKIGLLENGQCVDRNGNGTIDTSRDLNGNGVIDAGEVLPWGEDECVLREVIVISGKEGSYIPGTYAGGYVNDYWNPGPRSVAVDKDNNVWLGTYGTQKFYYLDGTNGNILKTVNVPGHSPYGATMDANGNVWSSGNANNILQLDTKTDPPTPNIFAPGFNVYGITADHKGHIFTAGNPDSRLGRLNASTREVDWSLAMPSCGRGLSVDSSDNVWVATSCTNKVFRYSNDGTLLAQIAVATSPTGVAVDSYDRVWAIGSAEAIYRIDPSTNAVDLAVPLPGSAGHYAYSDMTGVVVRTITTRIGTWSVVHDGGAANRPWGTITWSADVPALTSFQVKVRSSNDLATWSDWEIASSGALLKATPDGRYLMVMVTFTGGPAGETPLLHSLSIAPAAAPLGQRDQTPPSGSIQINGGSSVTNNAAALLTLAATDDSGTVSRMRFATDGSTWGEWVGYETSRGWTLAAGDGPKSIYVQYKDVAGNVSPAVHATIELHTTLPTTTIAPAGGCYRSAQTVTLGADEQATIYYTTDGSDPATSLTAQTYTGALNVSQPTRLRYYARDVWGYSEATVKEAAYSFMTGTPLESITPSGAGIPASGLSAWLRGDAGTCSYLNGTISGWYDLSGNGTNFFGSGASVLPNELNGKAMVKFDGSHLFAPSVNPLGTPYTVFTVTRQDGTVKGRLVGSTNINWLLGYWSGYEDEFHAGNWVYRPDTPAAGAPSLYTASGDGMTSSFYRNGTKLAENGNGVSPPGYLSLGGSLYGEYADGKVAELIAYDRVLSDSERSQVESYLKARYALSYPLTVSVSGSGAGTVTGDAAPALSCSQGSCSSSYAAGTRVTLSAAPAAGSVFWGWSGPCSGTGACVVTVDKARSVSALFDPLPHPEFGMLLHYPLNGDATDLSGFNRTGTLTGTTAAADLWGGDGKALAFNGSGDYIQVPPFVLGGAFSVSAWVYVNNVGTSWQRIFDFGNGQNNDNILVTFTGSKMMLSIRHGGSAYEFTTADSFPQQQWVQVTVAHDGIGTGKIYWNGVLKGSAQVPPPLFRARSTQYIGKSNWGDPNFSGILDEFQVYDRELTRTEIDTLAAVPPAPPGTVLTLNLEGAPGYNSVSIDPAGITCTAATCTAALTSGATVTLTAHPHESSGFAGWSGDCSGTGATCTLSMSAARNVTATFDAVHTGLVADYPFTGDADDASGNGLHGTVNGPVLTADRFGSDNRAYLFDGVNDYILVGDPVPAPLKIQNEITLEAWIYVAEYPPGLAQIVGSQYDGTASGATIFLDSRVNPDGQTAPQGHIHFQIGNGSWHVTNSNSQVPLNQWVHIVATRRAYEDARIYYNGVLQPSTSATWLGGVTYNNAWFAIGQQKDQNRPFKGKIDDVRIYGRVLSASEVQAHYAQAASDYTLSVTVSSNNGGGGSVHSVPAGIACTAGNTCSATFTNNESVTLHASSDSVSIFDGWVNGCTGTGDCVLTMDADKTVGAGFTLASPLRILRTPSVPYVSLQAAYDQTGAQDVIEMREGVLTGPLTADRPVSVILKGGFSPTYTSRPGRTNVNGKVLLRSGTVRADGVAVR